MGSKLQALFEDGQRRPFQALERVLRVPAAPGVENSEQSGATLQSRCIPTVD